MVPILKFAMIVMGAKSAKKLIGKIFGGNRRRAQKTAAATTAQPGASSVATSNKAQNFQALLASQLAQATPRTAAKRTNFQPSMEDVLNLQLRSRLEQLTQQRQLRG
jgi:hypothetical protein